MKSIMKSTGVTRIVLVLSIFLLAGCPPLPPPPPTGCAAKNWIDVSPYFGSQEIFEAKGVADPSPIFQKQRMDAIENGIEVLSMLLETNVDGYSQDMIHEFQDYIKEGTNSNVLYDRLRTISHENTLKRIKMDECPDNETGRYWVFVYVTSASIEEATLDAFTDLADFIAQEYREDFEKKRDDYRAKARQRNQELQNLINNRLGISVE